MMDNGVNLSGGQKQRIALAAYSIADIYLQGDCLPDAYLLNDYGSAVDGHVGQQAFDNPQVLGERGFLGGETHLKVVHNSDIMNIVDMTSYMDRGTILGISALVVYFLYQEQVDMGSKDHASPTGMDTTTNTQVEKQTEENT
jgi:ABC-type polar amino acid transport system ATPase subunit